MSRYILTENITVQAGTEFVVSDDLGVGGVCARFDYGVMTVHLGRAAALEQGMIVARPALKVVEGCGNG